jgi:hypothetical protein
VGRDGKSHSLICISEKQKYFFQQDWTAQISLIRLNKFAVMRKPAASLQDRLSASAFALRATADKSLGAERVGASPWPRMN